MPYMIRGKSVVKKNTGEVVGHSTNPKKYLKVLNAVEHDWKSSGKKMHAAMGAAKRRKKRQ